MKNNRNTLLIVSGIANIVKSVGYAILLLVVSINIDIIDVALRMKVYSGKIYQYSTAMGERLITFVIVGMFLYLSIAIFLSFGAGLININQSRMGVKPLNMRNFIIIFSVINMITFISFGFSIVALVALTLDKKQPDAIKEEETNEELKQKVNELKQLKAEGSITQKEFLDMLTKILVE